MKKTETTKTENEKRIRAIKKVMRENRFSQNELAKKAGVSQALLSKNLAGSLKVSDKTINKIKEVK